MGVCPRIVEPALGTPSLGGEQGPQNVDQNQNNLPGRSVWPDVGKAVPACFLEGLGPAPVPPRHSLPTPSKKL